MKSMLIVRSNYYFGIFIVGQREISAVHLYTDSVIKNLLQWLFKKNNWQDPPSLLKKSLQVIQNTKRDTLV